MSDSDADMNNHIDACYFTPRKGTTFYRVVRMHTDYGDTVYGWIKYTITLVVMSYMTYVYLPHVQCHLVVCLLWCRREFASWLLACVYTYCFHSLCKHSVGNEEPSLWSRFLIFRLLEWIDMYFNLFIIYLIFIRIFIITWFNNCHDEKMCCLLNQSPLSKRITIFNLLY